MSFLVFLVAFGDPFGAVFCAIWLQTPAPKTERRAPFGGPEGPGVCVDCCRHCQREGEMDPKGDYRQKSLVWNLFVKNLCFFVNAKDTWILFDFHENPRVLDGNEKTCIFGHFPKGYIIKNGGSQIAHFWDHFSLAMETCRRPNE